MENLYIAYRLLEDFGIGKICKTDFEPSYLNLKSRSDLTLRIAKIYLTFSIDNLENYMKTNWTSIKETENLSDFEKLVCLFTLYQLLVCKYKIISDTTSIAFLAFLFIELSSELEG